MVEQLPDEDFARFADQVRALRLRRSVPGLSADETMLLARINRALTSAERQRYAELVRVRDAEQLTPSEYDELITLTDRREFLVADRLAAAVDLARLRGLPLAELLTSLGLTASRDA